MKLDESSQLVSCLKLYLPICTLEVKHYVLHFFLRISKRLQVILRKVIRGLALNCLIGEIYSFLM